MGFFRGSQWQQLPFLATDIALTATGDVFIVGGDQGTYGNCLYKLDPNGTPQRVSQDADVSAASFCSNGLYANLIATDGRLNLFNIYTNSFEYGDKYALDAARGSDGSFYWIGSDTFTPGKNIYKLADSDYGPYSQQFPGRATKLTVDGGGNPWIVDDNLDIYRFRVDTPMAIEGKARDICASTYRDKTVYIIGRDYRIYGAGYTYEKKEPWALIPDIINTPVRVAVSPEGVPWYIDQFNNVYKRI